MQELRKRFGRLVAAHRRRIGITQQALADAADVSVDTIAKIEGGATGARFPVIERLAAALHVDPAELFTAELPAGGDARGAYAELSVRLVGLSEVDLKWIAELIEVALKPRGGNRWRTRARS